MEVVYTDVAPQLHQLLAPDAARLGARSLLDIETVVLSTTRLPQDWSDTNSCTNSKL